MLALSISALGGGCSSGTGDVIIASGAARYPNQTASDWLTYADHVVIASAASETALPMDGDDRRHDEGHVDRKVTLNVDRVLWSRGDASRPAPDGQFEWNAWGWALQDGERIPMASAGAPRIEVGHTYIMAIAWEPAFDDGHDHVPAHWVGLGPDAILPYDDGVIGKGELAGREVSGASPRPTSDPNFSLEDELAGRTAEDLLTALQSAEPEQRLDY